MNDKLNHPGLQAASLRWILVGLISFGLLIGIGGSWYLNDKLASKVKVTSAAVMTSEASLANLERAQSLKVYLANNKDGVEKAASIVAQTSEYQYQNQIVTDLTRYATSANVVITGFNFPQDIASAKVDKSTGLKSLSTTITLSDGTLYTNYLRFLKLIEQNLTKMQIIDITLTPSPTDQNQINDTSIGIQVYVK